MTSGREVVDSEAWQQIGQAQYDPDEDGELATALVYAIADALDVDPLDHEQLPPLYDVVDAASLEETLFGTSRTGSIHGDGGAVTFQYVGCTIAVGSDGWISVYEPR